VTLASGTIGQIFGADPARSLASRLTRAAARTSAG